VRKITTAEFITRANKIHNNKFDYSLVNYINNNTKVIIICPIHGKFTQKPLTHTNQACGCPLCAPERMKQTVIEKYGVDHPWKNKQVQEKKKQNFITKYGTEHPSQTEGVKAKQKQTNFDKHNGKWANQTEEKQEQSKQTMIKKYGVEYPLQSKVCLDNLKQNNQKKYGCDYPTQTHLINILPLLEDPIWMYTEYVTKRKSAHHIAYELGDVSYTTVIKYLRMHGIEIRLMELSSLKCAIWLESIMKQEHIYIQYDKNDGEFFFEEGSTKRADGYCADTNTIYEFHGNYWHGNPTLYDASVWNEWTKSTMGDLYQATIERENKIKALGYNLVVMWESEWDKLTC
jgi:flagellar hook protein FlgE